jgi:putative GTP pyrophosphokinase
MAQAPQLRPAKIVLSSVLRMSLFKPKILDEFSLVRPQLEASVAALGESLQKELELAGIRLHSFNSRLKTEESLRAKISRPDKNYDSLWEITDLIGFRLVTAFEDSVEEIGKLMEARLPVDLANSRNRMQFEDHERFGYRSLHYVCFFPRLPGLDLPPQARFEVQVRTALQDVWAELEHDLGYKASDIAPSSLRRRFSRISSLLEIADEELVAIKRELRAYLEGAREHLRLDLISLQELARQSEVEAADLAIAKKLGLGLGENVFYPDYLLRALQLAGLGSPHGVLEALAKGREQILEFLPLYFEFAREAWGLEQKEMQVVPRGYSLLFLAHIALLGSDSLAVNRTRQLANFYSKLDRISDQSKAWQVAGRLVDAIEHRPTPAKREL